jgi:hypothetical protein
MLKFKDFSGDVALRGLLAVSLIATLSLSCFLELPSAGPQGGGDDGPTDNGGGSYTHNFGGWYAVIDATCFESGQERRDCACGTSEIRAISPLTGSACNTRAGRDAVVPANAISISSFQDLCKIGHDAAYPLSANYVLTADIDASSSRTMNGGQGFLPIGGSGDYSGITGAFYGKGYEIKGLYINRPNAENVGLFKYSTGTINGVHLVDGHVVGNNSVGGLVGGNNGLIISSSFSGYVEGTGGSYCGGLTGFGYSGDGNGIVDSYFAGTVTSSGSSVGGLAATSFAPITRSYFTGTAKGNSTAGGLLGSAWSTITDSYVIGSVTGSRNVGGLIGMVYSDEASINRSDSAAPVNGNTTGGGGLVGSGFQEAPVINSYWDVNASGQSSSHFGGTGKTTAEMKNSSTYAGWDFSSTWQISDDNYPHLRALGHTATLPRFKTATPVAFGMPKAGEWFNPETERARDIAEDFAGRRQ